LLASSAPSYSITVSNVYPDADISASSLFSSHRSNAPSLPLMS